MRQFTRRDFIHAAASGTAVLGAGSLLEACGAAGSKHASPSQTTNAKPRSGGTLNVGITGGGPTDTLNALRPQSPGSAARVINMYDGLAEIDAVTGHPTLSLADEITPNADATQWTIRVRKGVEFHNGKELTADDVIYTFQAVQDPKNAASAASLLASIDGKALKKLDKYTVRVPCKRPFSTLIDTLSIPLYSSIIPTGYDPRRPVGTGPFKISEFSPGNQSVQVKFPNYWKPGLPYLDKLVITDFSETASQVNALISGQMDCVDGVSASDAARVKTAGKDVVVSPGSGYAPFAMRTDQVPFNDVRVRQAMRLCVDRPQMLKLVYGDAGTVGNDVFGIWAPEYDHSLPQRQQDIPQAKSLLKQAGQQGLTVELLTAPLYAGVVEEAQVLAQQAQAAGMKVNVQQVTENVIFGPRYPNFLFYTTHWFNNLYFPAVALSTLPSSPFNETHFNNSTYTKLYAQALATVDPRKRTELAHEMQRIDYNEGGYIIPIFEPILDAHDPRVHGIIPTKIGVPLNGWRLATVYLSDDR